MSYPTTPAYLTISEAEFEQQVTAASLRYASVKMRQHAARKAKDLRRAAGQLELMATLVETNADNTETGKAWLEAVDLTLGQA